MASDKARKTREGSGGRRGSGASVSFDGVIAPPPPPAKVDGELEEVPMSGDAMMVVENEEQKRTKPGSEEEAAIRPKKPRKAGGWG